MNDPKIILTIATIIWGLLGGLIVYIVKMKDKSEESTSGLLKEMKVMLTGISNTIGIMDTQLTNNIKATDELTKDARMNKELLHKLELKVNTLIQQRIQQEKEIGELKRKSK